MVYAIKSRVRILSQSGEMGTTNQKRTPAWVLIMGVSGAGKSTIGQLVAERLGGIFIEGDDYHPSYSKEKMKSGVPLNEKDREPWLEAILATVRTRVKFTIPVVACSALREAHRKKLAELPYSLIYLKGNFAEIRNRINSRSSHFMPVSLLENQFETLEEPSNAMVVSVGLDKKAVVEKVIDYWLAEQKCE